MFIVRVLSILVFTLALQTACHGSEIYHLNRSGYGNMDQCPSAKGREIKIAFWNLFTTFLSDSPKNPFEKYLWKNRKHAMIQLIKHDRPDVMGFCEGTVPQMDDFEACLLADGYKIAGFSSNLIKTVKEVQEDIHSGGGVWYSELVGCIYNSERLRLLSIERHELEPGFKHKRILVKAKFLDNQTGIVFCVLVSHFDHLSLSSIQKSGEAEIGFLKELEDHRIPWFSIGDRNWDFDTTGDAFADEYIRTGFITDFRDGSEEGHFGPFGTYPGYPWCDPSAPPIITDCKGRYQMLAKTTDVGFWSPSLMECRCSYTLTGQFDPLTYDLLDQSGLDNIEERNFASDHYYFGAIFQFCTSIPGLMF